MQPDHILSAVQLPEREALLTPQQPSRPEDDHRDPLGKPEGFAWHVPVDVYVERYMRPVILTKRLTVLKAGQGVGKTEQGLRAMASSKQAILITHRRTLATDLQQRFNRLGPTQPAQHYLQANLATAEKSLVIVANSLHRLNTANYSGALIYLDEVAQLLDALADETFKEHRLEVLIALRNLLRSAAHVLAADKDVEPQHVELLMQLMDIGPEAVDVHYNAYTPPDRTVYWHEKPDGLVDILFERTAKGKKAFVAIDNKTAVLQLSAILAEQHLAVQHVVGAETSTGVEEQRRHNLLADINDGVKNLDALLVSPALFTGVDISCPHFDDVYVIATNGTKAIPSTDFIQALHRVRKPHGTIHVWANPGTHDLPATYAEDVEGAPSFKLSLIRDRQDRKIAEAYLDYERKARALRNADVNRLADNLQNGLKAAGYRIETVEDPARTTTDALWTLHPTATKPSPCEHAQLVATIHEAAAHLQADRTTGAFLVNLDEPAATFLARRYYALNGNSWQDFEDIARYLDPNDFRRDIENFELLSTPLGELLRRDRIQAIRSLGLNPGYYVRRARLLADLRNALGGSFHADAPLDAPTLAAVHAVFQKHAATLKTAYGQSAPKANTISTLKALLAKMGMRVKSSRTRTSPGRPHMHSIDVQSVALMERVLARRESQRPAGNSESELDLGT